MISFYPGPSCLYPEVPAYMQEACTKGILSINHRSPEFIEISKKTISLLKEKLNIPETYSIFYTSSATECWEIIAQSFIQKKSYHLYNGAFGYKWKEQTLKLHSECSGHNFGIENALGVTDLAIPNDVELIAITQNETSNGTEVTNATLTTLRNNYPTPLIAIDATSSMGGIALDFNQGDIWYASVQKCFGLPAGMALLICSPKAIDRALQIGDHNYYNSMTNLIENMKNFQTTHTPNVLAIYLLMKLMEGYPTIDYVEQKLEERANNWYDFFSTQQEFGLLIKNKAIRSKTVITVNGDINTISKLKQEAKENGLLLGNGYGDWKTSTFRIANFPAIKATDNELLKDFIRRFSLNF